MASSKFTIQLDYHSLQQVKNKFRIHHCYPKSRKVFKSDCEIWLASLVEADLDDINEDNDEIEETETE